MECCEFHWAKISPAVFGSLFQGVIDDRARRQQGAHYTSERDIMKVIRSLFLDELRSAFEQLKRDRSTRQRANLEGFQQKLRSLKFLDPACGCGNFLVLGYRELRQLELEVIRELHGTEQQALNVRDLCKVDVDQFYGIEYSEWPVRIAEVAMWLMDHQMNAQAAETFGQRFERLPLRISPHIVQANALCKDWNEVLPREECSFVLGNPPFIGKAFQSVAQRQDMELVCGRVKGAGVLDYVTGWYFKAADYIHGTAIAVGFVSTNSISQGEQVGILWGELFRRWPLKIHFAHRTFPWASETRGKAHVHVVIIGFAAFDILNKRIFDYEAETPTVATVRNISPYLVEGNDVVITKKSLPPPNTPELSFGSMPNDGGHLLLSETERQELLAVEPTARAFIRPFIGPDEFLYNVPRYCLWLVGVPPAAVRGCPHVLRRIEQVKEHRKKSARPTTNELAATPNVFGEIRQPTSRYLAVPKTTSERRNYIPMAFLEPATIAGTDIFTAPNATPFHFGILSSTMHMAWVRIVSGRMKSDYRYSAGLVYNNFPWPTPSPEQRQRVEEKAQAVLDVRAPHLPPRSISTLADLYDPNTMPPELHRAHTQLDRAVERCYRAEPFGSDRERVEHLFRLYEQLTAPLLPATPRTRFRRQQAAATTPRPRRGRTLGLPAAD
jgi:hypothetical protein